MSFGVGSLVLVAYLRSPRSLVALAFRGVRVQPELFKEILRVGVPGMINTGITNLSVVVLTGIAGHLGRETAIGYAMGARLEYILIPLAFGFGTAIVAMVGTNWGARQFSRARRIAWIGGANLRIVGPIYALYGLGMALYFATQGLGRVLLAVLANGLRLLASAGGALLALYWLDAGATGFFIAVAAGFAMYGALTAAALVHAGKSETQR